uniref:Serine racemase n=1 Tax=Acrobeloides nanus TaxID=290746 RepID=A0A914C3H4_9BILA
MSVNLNRQSIDDAHERISKYIHRTPVLTSRKIDSLVGNGTQLFFKCENLQKTGSFKSRGALNAILTAKKRGDFKGVITHSSGNHGQGLAWAANMLGVPCIVVAPNDSSIAKMDAIRAYGAKIEYCEPSMTSREETCERLSKENGYLLIHSHNDYDIMAGQGTIVKEFREQVPNLDVLLVAIGGGGFIGGISAYVKEINSRIKVFAVEPQGKEFQKSLEAGRNLCDSGALLDTIADGAKSIRVADKCFPLIHECCQHRVFSVNDEELANAMLIIMQHLKVVIEPTAALGLAAVLKFREEFEPDQKIGLILCGGNVNLTQLPF